MKHTYEHNEGGLIGKLNISNIANITDSFNFTNVLNGNLSNNSILNNLSILSGNDVDVSPAINVGDVDLSLIDSVGDVLPVNVLSQNLASPVSLDIVDGVLSNIAVDNLLADVAELDVGNVLTDVGQLDIGNVTTAVSAAADIIDDVLSPNGIVNQVSNVGNLDVVPTLLNGQIEDTLDLDLANDLIGDITGAVQTSIGNDLVGAVTSLDVGNLVDLDTGPLTAATNVVGEITDTDVSSLVAQLGQFNFGGLGIGDTIDLGNVGAIVGADLAGGILASTGVDALLHELDLFNIDAFSSDEA